MDFIKILKSFEEFIYEVLSWLVFYPRTLWRAGRHPIRMARYAEYELSDPLRTQFTDALSPPLFLLLSVVISHILELVLHAQIFEEHGQLGKLVFGSEQNLLMYRTISFGVWALLGALYLLWRTGQPIDRDSMRRPFYAQCYLVAPFAIALSTGATLVRQADPVIHWAGLSIMPLACIWYVAVQAAWIREVSKLPWWRTLGAAFVLMLAGLAINTTVAVALLLV